MAAISPQTLLAEAKCFLCYGPLTETQLLRLAYLARMLKTLNPNVAADPQSLLAYGKCFPCFSNSSLGDMMELSLLDQISQNIGGSSGASCLYCGAVDPVAPPTCVCALAYNTLTGSLWYWDAGVATWFAMIGGAAA